MSKLRIRVPGSTANLGPGFDSIGLAINRYLNLEVSPSDRWTFNYSSPEYADIPQNEENLIYKAFKLTAEQKGVQAPYPACKVEIDCDLPLARGLGSSAAAIVAGIEIANILLELSLTKNEKVRIGSLYEGHPDNVGASIYGGLTIASHQEDETFIVSCGNLPMDFVLIVPPEQLLTSHSRNVLPESLSFRGAVQGSSIANVMVASLLKGDYQTAGKMMSRDHFHQPYRAKIVPGLEKITSFVADKGAYGVALSGAGPAVMVYLEAGKAEKLVHSFRVAFPNFDIERLESVSKGAEIEIIN